MELISAKVCSLKKKDFQLKHFKYLFDSLAFVAVRGQLAPSVKQYAFDFKKDASIPIDSINLDTLMGEASTSRLSGPQRANYNDKMLYIYTSGTTGLPKAVSGGAVKFSFIKKKRSYFTFVYFRLLFATLGKKPIHRIFILVSKVISSFLNTFH